MLPTTTTRSRIKIDDAQACAIRLITSAGFGVGDPCYPDQVTKHPLVLIGLKQVWTSLVSHGCAEMRRGYEKTPHGLALLPAAMDAYQDWFVANDPNGEFDPFVV